MTNSRGALGALLLIAAVRTEADADGELTPMVGVAFVGARASENAAELLGFEVEAAFWRGPLGLAAEGSMRWGIDEARPRASVAGVSARLRLFECLVPSLLDSRDIVELGIEVHAIAEHIWWGGTDAPAYGFGLAARLRGGGDDGFSTLLAESRLFVHVVASHVVTVDAIPRTEAPMESRDARDLTVTIGIGAAFGDGDSGYLRRFQAGLFDSTR